jgi:O-acetyl-ADP-ribose deacetylase (regulator of RNase III)
VIPALGCGVAGFDLAEGAAVVGDAIAEYDADSLVDVQFVGYGEEADTIRRVVE